MFMLRCLFVKVLEERNPLLYQSETYTPVLTAVFSGNITNVTLAPIRCYWYGVTLAINWHSTQTDKVGALLNLSNSFWVNVGKNCTAFLRSSEKNMGFTFRCELPKVRLVGVQTLVLQPPTVPSDVLDVYDLNQKFITESALVRECQQCSKRDFAWLSFQHLFHKWIRITCGQGSWLHSRQLL